VASDPPRGRPLAGIPDDDVLVLHVDDDPAFGSLVATHLERRDDSVDVRTETDPTAAIDHLDAAAIDCVVSDYQMPELDGLELLESVRDVYPNLPFVLFTAHGSERIAADAIDAGVTTYLRKGSNDAYDRLANRVRNAVDGNRSERRSRVAQERVFELYEQADGFFSLADDWTITYWNRTMEARTGVGVDDVVGRAFLDAFPAAAGTDLHERYEQAMTADDPVEFDTYYDPHGYWLHVRAFPVDDGLFVHSRDVTAEYERARELEERNQVLESFASTVSHDLRNPLATAEGRLELARETGETDHLDEVAQAHERMHNLIDELLRLARGEDPEFETVSLRDAAADAWRTVSANETSLVVDDDAAFDAHAPQLRRLFENLFWNAVEHGDADEIRVGRLPSGFYVEDDGPGIPEADRERVLESGYSSVEGNPGFGLHIVAGIVDLHGWQIDVTESAAGGARFEVTDVDVDDRRRAT